MYHFEYFLYITITCFKHFLQERYQEPYCTWRKYSRTTTHDKWQKKNINVQLWRRENEENLWRRPAWDAGELRAPQSAICSCKSVEQIRGHRAKRKENNRWPANMEQIRGSEKMRRRRIQQPTTCGWGSWSSLDSMMRGTANPKAAEQMRWRGEGGVLEAAQRLLEAVTLTLDEFYTAAMQRTRAVERVRTTRPSQARLSRNDRFGRF